MSRQKQIEQIKEIAKYLCQNTMCGLDEWNECELSDGVYCLRCTKLATNLYNAGNRKASEVAREIFEEIERFLYIHFRFCKEEIGNDDTQYVKGRLELNTQIQNFIAELKKKYTEGQK